MAKRLRFDGNLFDGIPVLPTAEVGQTIVVKAVDENGKPIEWEAVEFPECVLSVNGVEPDKNGNVIVETTAPTATQPDWNQNDSTQPDYVKNRPFYSETGLVDENVILVEEADYTSESQTDYGGAFGALTPFADVYDPRIGIATVVFDGVEYPDLQMTYLGAIDAYVCGNMSILNPLGLSLEDTGEPFVYAITEGNDVGMLATDLTQSTTHNFSMHMPESLVNGVYTTKVDDVYGRYVTTIHYIKDISSSNTGDMLRIILDDTVYDCSIKYDETLYSTFGIGTYVGNGSIVNVFGFSLEDTGELFAMLVGGSYCILVTDPTQSTTHRVRLIEYTENVVTIPDKYLNIEVPTKVSQLTNDSSYATQSYVIGRGYQTASQVKSTVTSYGYQTASQVQALIDASLGVIENGSY